MVRYVDVYVDGCGCGPPVQLYNYSRLKCICKYIEYIGRVARYNL